METIPEQKESINADFDPIIGKQLVTVTEVADRKYIGELWTTVPFGEATLHYYETNSSVAVVGKIDNGEALTYKYYA